MQYMFEKDAIFYCGNCPCITFDSDRLPFCALALLNGDDENICNYDFKNPRIPKECPLIFVVRKDEITH